MNTQTKILPPEVLLEEYRRLLQQEQTVEALPLTVTGNSMAPFLVGGRDTVYLSRLERPVRRGDIVLYRRSGGAYVLHRVYAVTEQGYTMVGDAQTELEPGIREEQLIAGVKRVTRKGKAVKQGSICWFFFEKVWIRLVPVRNILWKLYSCLRAKV